MSIASAVARFRVKQAEQFSDTATVRRPVGEPEFDPVTEEYTQGAVTIYTDCPCKLRPVAIRGEDEATTGETLIATPDSECKFGVDSDVQRGDIVTITASTYDGTLAGRSFTIKRVPHDAWQISRVAIVEEFLPPLLNEVS